jgi:hypothetical protein
MLKMVQHARTITFIEKTTFSMPNLSVTHRQICHALVVSLDDSGVFLVQSVSVDTQAILSFHWFLIWDKYFERLHTLWPGANPTIVSYNAIAVKIYNAASSLVRFITDIFASTLKNVLAYVNSSKS